MSNTTITSLPTASGIDGAADWLAIDRTSLGTTQKINRQTLLGVTGQPMDISSSQNVTNKTLDNTNTVTLKDTLFTLQDDSDTTKQARFQLSGITTATTRTYTLPNASSTIADISSSQTFTNKTLTAPVINNGSITGTTITTDAIVGQSVATNGTVYGLSISSGKVGTNGVITASITDASVTTAKLASGVNFKPVTVEQNPYKFSVYRNAAWTTPNNTQGLVTFDTVLFDTSSNYSTSTGKFTAPAAGFYFFTAQADLASALTGAYITIYVNGAEVKRGYPTNASTFGGTVSGLLSLSSSDFVQIYIFTPSVVNGSTSKLFVYFDGFMVSAT